MTPLLAGLGTALGWACATLCAAASSRRIGGAATLAWVMLSGIVVCVPLAAATGWPEGLDASAAGWLALAGVGNVGGLALIYAAMRTGEVGVVASIASAEGAVAALLAVSAGERPAALTAIGFLPVLVGIALVAVPRTRRRGGPAPPAYARSRWRAAPPRPSASACSPPGRRAARSPSAGWRCPRASWA